MSKYSEKVKRRMNSGSVAESPKSRHVTSTYWNVEDNMCKLDELTKRDVKIYKTGLEPKTRIRIAEIHLDQNNYRVEMTITRDGNECRYGIEYNIDSNKRPSDLEKAVVRVDSKNSYLTKNEIRAIDSLPSEDLKEVLLNTIAKNCKLLD